MASASQRSISTIRHTPFTFITVSSNPRTSTVTHILVWHEGYAQLRTVGSLSCTAIGLVRLDDLPGRLTADEGGSVGTIQERIVVDPQICGGKPCIRGTRIMVKNILGMLAGGYDMEQILHAYPELSREDVVAALDYASSVVDEEKVVALGA